MRILRIWLLGLIGLSLTGCGLNLAPGDTYRSKRGNFTCVVPPLIGSDNKQIERYEGDNTFVSFSDDFGNLLRIESSPILPEEKARIAAIDEREALDMLFDRGVMQIEFHRASPLAYVERRENVDTTAGLALYCVVVIPGGSTLAQADSTGKPHPLDSTRGVLIFMKNGYVYIMSNQMLEPPFKDDTGHMLAELQNTVTHMTFN